MSSWGVAPARSAERVWPRMQYGHCVTCATATATISLVLKESAPSANTCLLNSRNARSVSGARLLRRAASVWGDEPAVWTMAMLLTLVANGHCGRRANTSLELAVGELPVDQVRQERRDVVDAAIL